MGLWDKIGEAKVNGGGNPMRRILNPGDDPLKVAGTPAFFELRVKRFWTDNTRNKGAGIFAEFEVVGTSHPDFRIGQTVDWCALSGGAAADMFLINAKKIAVALLAAMLGETVDQNQIDASVMELLTGPGEGTDGKPTPAGYKCAGLRINATVSGVARKNGAGFIDVPSWSWPGAEKA